MELTYRLTRNDYGQVSWLAVKRLARRARIPLAPWFLLASTLVTLAVLIWVQRHHPDEPAIFLVAWLAYAWGIGSFFIVEWIARRQLRADALPVDSRALGDLHLTMDGDGVVGSDGAETTRYSWRAFDEISEHRGLILLWCGRLRCVAVPASALPDDAARRDFVAFARERIAQAAAQK
jgi:hypothetical protein